jgi:hypothetical protein
VVGFSSGMCSDTSPNQCDAQQQAATVFAVVVGLVLAACLVGLIAWLVRRFVGTRRIARPGRIVAGLTIAPMPTIAIIVGLAVGGGVMFEVTLMTAAVWTVGWGYALGRMSRGQPAPA